MRFLLLIIISYTVSKINAVRDALYINLRTIGSNASDLRYVNFLVIISHPIRNCHPMLSPVIQTRREMRASDFRRYLASDVKIVSTQIKPLCPSALVRAYSQCVKCVPCDIYIA